MPAFNNTFASLDPALWTIANNRTVGGAYACSFTQDAVSTVNNELHLSVFPGEFGQNSYGCGQLTHTSNFTYGIFGAKFQAVNEPGIVTALFTYVETKPDINQEIDIEITGANTSVLLATSYRNGNATTAKIPLGFDAAASTHDYAFEWRKAYIAWQVDGREVYRLTDGLPLALPTSLFMNTWLRKPSDFAGEYNASVIRPATNSLFDWFAYQP
jgi:endo-1,3-1,4-beta-glycanase ExoK